MFIEPNRAAFGRWLSTDPQGPVTMLNLLRFRVPGGPDGERWDRVLLVRHPSAQAFLGFAANPGYLAGVGHRTAALADSRLIPTTAR